MTFVSLRPGWILSRHPEGILLTSVTRRASSVLVRGVADSLLPRLKEDRNVDALDPFWSRLVDLGMTTVRRLDDFTGLAVEDRHRFARQIDFLEDALGDRRAAVETQMRIGDLRVGVVGVGGVGSHVVQAFAAVGVRRFKLADPDHIELSNLSRQLLYRPCDVGRPKVERAAEWLAEFCAGEVESDQSAVRSLEEASAFAAGTDLVVVTAGPIPTALNRWFNSVAQRTGLLVVPVGGASFGPLLSSSEACWECFETALDDRRDALSQSLKDSLPEFTNVPHTPVVDPPLRQTAGACAADLLEYLSTGRCQTQGHIVSRHPATGDLTRWPVARNAGCRLHGDAS
jgi:ThiF family